MSNFMHNMDCTSNFISYSNTGFFSNLVADYLSYSDDIRGFYAHEPDIEGIRQAIIQRETNQVSDRALLVSVLKEQYQGVTVSAKVQSNIDALANEHVYAITTAHQPNIFSGPLYFIYKILHAVKLAEELQSDFPSNKFVPVYYMGSEDADLDELGFVNVGGVNVRWETKQTGAVGRMKVDKSFLALIHAIEGQIAVWPHGAELVEIFKTVYTEGKTIQQATLELVNHLFSEFGVVVLIPDQPKLKACFKEVVKKELLESFSHKLVVETTARLSQKYKVQTSGRDINLFYLKADRRERIELENNLYKVKALDLQFTQEQLLKEMDEYPERFSPNVILRGVFQEKILPGIVFIGGGAELAYWMELMQVFKAVDVPYPVLLLRNSFLFIEKEQQERLKKLQINHVELFMDQQEYINTWVKEKTKHELSLSKELAELSVFYQQLQEKATQIDQSLNDHVLSLQVKAAKKLEVLEKKMLRAEKAKYETHIRQFYQLKSTLFPSGSLQERQENFSLLYAKYGQEWIRAIYQHSFGLKKAFGIIEMS